MLKLTIKTREAYDESTQSFVLSSTFDVELEHSLYSLSKWESFFEKPFLTNKDKTPEEMLWYIQAMCVTPNIPPEVFQSLSNEHIESIQQHISAKMTATWFSDKNAPKTAAGQVVTAELIYYWMVAMSIPFECQHWHLNRLLTLVKVCNEQNKPQKKLSRREMAEKRRELNEQRLKAYETTG